jgi:hypothetical protein
MAAVKAVRYRRYGGPEIDSVYLPGFRSRNRLALPFLTQHSRLAGVAHGLRKVAEVLGCLLGLLVSVLMSRIWPLAETEEKTALAATR